MKVWKTGDKLLVSFADKKRVPAVVKLASPNGQSLMIEFDTMLGGYLRMMPLLWENGTFRDLI